MPDDWNLFKNNYSTSLDIEFLKKQVGQFFPFYDFKYNINSVAFFCRIDKESLEQNFDSLRKSLSKNQYFPMLRYEKGEHIIYIIQKPKRKEKPIWINISLFIAVIITTIITGSILHLGEFSYWNLSNGMEVFSLNNLFFGALYFSLPLMSILFIHEMGHYFISKKHGIGTSLPFFLPIPPILPIFNIGTFGALIQSNDPMPNKKVLFDVGLSGPLAGFLVAIPITIIGILNAEIIPITSIENLPSGEIVFGSSLLIDVIVQSVVPTGYTIEMNPILFAGWVGLLITSINLLPAGQLDGGHIFRAVLGEKQKYAGWIAILIMIFTGWTFFAIIIVFMMGMMHPPPLNDDSELDIKRKLLFFIALLILILCFIPWPISQI